LTDVIGGLLLGAAIGIAVTVTAIRLRRRSEILLAGSSSPTRTLAPTRAAWVKKLIWWRPATKVDMGDTQVRIILLYFVKFSSELGDYLQS
jgi:hypothetical protein